MMTRSKLERDIQTAICKYLNGCSETWHINVPGGSMVKRGTPDILVCHKGRFIALELKRPDGNYGVTHAQRGVMKSITKAGGVAAVVTSVQDVAEVLYG